MHGQRVYRAKQKPPGALCDVCRVRVVIIELIGMPRALAVKVFTSQFFKSKRIMQTKRSKNKRPLFKKGGIVTYHTIQSMAIVCARLENIFIDTFLYATAVVTSGCHFYGAGLIGRSFFSRRRRRIVLFEKGRFPNGPGSIAAIRCFSLPLLQAPSIRKLFAVSPTARRHVFSDIDVKKKNRQRETRGKQVAFVSKS